ncbi:MULTISPECIES: DsbA family protein [unclassified Streptomyces]|uniref:DsbA family protein n=1 Tax=Streptomyces sp. NPDC127129 TaxID=3345373 RepID=UPI003641DA71
MPVRRTVRAVVALAAAGVVGLAAAGCSAAPVAAPAVSFSTAAAGLTTVVEGPRILVGDPSAPHTATVFLDPRCSYCAKFDESGGVALAEAAAAGKVRIAYVVASFLDARSGGTASARSANALRASVEAGKFAEFQASVLASGGAEDPLRVADGVEGLRGAEFDRAVREGSYREWVASAEKVFEESGVGGTPTVLLDGQQVGVGGALYDHDAFARVLRDAGV